MGAQDKMNVHIASDDEMNQGFINARRRAESGESIEPEEHLYFERVVEI